MQSRFIDLVLEEKARGKTILMSSHMFEEVERTCDRVAIIKHGRLEAMDDVETLKAALSRKYVVTLENDDAAAAFAGEGLRVFEVSHNQVTVIVQNNIKDLISVMNRYPVVNIAAPNQNLEEIFLQYYGGGGRS
jgi:ABC-2 type transport system ATP-binding protein